MPKDKPEELKEAFKEPTKEMLKVLKEINKTTEDRISDLTKKQGSMLKGFVEKESPLLHKTFKFFKEGKKREKVRAALQAKNMGPLLIKGLSLGLLKFGVGGAIGAAKLFEVTESFQDYVKQEDADKQQQMIKMIDELRTGENPKTIDEVKDILKKQGVSGLAFDKVMKEYQELSNSRMNEIVAQGKEDGTKTDDIIKKLIESGVIIKQDTEISLEKADIDKERLELEKQVEQNEQLRHLERMDAEKDRQKDEGGDGGIFSGLKGMKGKLAGLATGLTALGPAVAIAGTAFLAFKAGGKISEWMDALTERITGEEGATAGGKIFDFFKGKDDKKISEDEFFTTQSGKNVLKSAKGKGFKVDAQTTREELDSFLRQQNTLAVKERESNRRQIEEAEAKKDEKIAEETTGGAASKAVTAEIVQELLKNLQINVNATSPHARRLDSIPSNSDDLQLAYMSKGDAS